MKTVNVVSSSVVPWWRHFPDDALCWEDYRFVFNAQTHYDFLVVYDNLPSVWPLACPAEHTLHVAMEPPSVRQYCDVFLRQFAGVITQDSRVTHPNPLFCHAGLTWYIGMQPGRDDPEVTWSFSQLDKIYQHPKTKKISVITSSKALTHEHRKRLAFVEALKNHYGDQLDLYGRGFKSMPDKLEALQDYHFHIVLENSQHSHYFSEKLTDCLIAGCYPIYAGCPNIHDYFSKEVVTQIDMHDVAGSIKIIDQVLANEYNLKYRQHLAHARQLALYEYNFFPMVVKWLNRLQNTPKNPQLFGQQLFPFGGRKYKQALQGRYSWSQIMQFRHFPDLHNRWLKYCQRSK